MNDAPAPETLEERKAHIARLRRLNSVLPKEQRHPIPALHDQTSPATGRPSHTTVEALLAMTRTAYGELVCGDLADDKDDAWQLYLNPQLVQFTHAVLIRKHHAVARLTRQTSESASSSVSRRRWKFLAMLESRIQQTEAALPDQVVTSDRNTAKRLFSAIQTHRRALASHGVQPEPWDLALWKTVDTLTVGDQEQD